MSGSPRSEGVFFFDFVIVLLFVSPAFADFSGRVVCVSDGDTIKVLPGVEKTGQATLLGDAWGSPSLDRFLAGGLAWDQSIRGIAVKQGYRLILVYRKQAAQSRCCVHIRRKR